MTRERTAWRAHPKLRGHFHPDYPDDIQVIVHQGHPILSGLRPELVWVQVTAAEEECFRGRVRNKPFGLRGVGEGTEILFIVPEGCDHPILVTNEYLEQRDTWRLLVPCRKCGLTELLSPPGELRVAMFPTLDANQVRHGFTFTAKCGWCGGGQVVRIERVLETERGGS